MTSERKRRIEELISKVETIKEDIKEVLDEEQDEFDNIPLKVSEDFTRAEEKMLEALENLDGAVESIRDVKGYLEQAIF